MELFWPTHRDIAAITLVSCELVAGQTMWQNFGNLSLGHRLMEPMSKRI